MMVQCAVCYGLGSRWDGGPCEYCFGRGQYDDPRVTRSLFERPVPVVPEPQDNPCIELSNN
jgi:hypothetical protein